MGQAYSIFQMSTLGVAVIELSWLTTMIHFSKGWLSHKSQATAAYVSLTFTTAILIANAITSHLAHYITAESGENALWFKWLFVDVYGSFVLPSTPILSVLAIGFLISYHPKVEQVSKSFQFMVQEISLKRDAAMARELASNKLQAQRLLSAGTKLMAELKAEEIHAQTDANQIESQAKQQAALMDFEHQRLQKTMTIQRTVMNEILDSAEFKQTLTNVEKSNIYAMLANIYPTFTPPAADQPAPASSIPTTPAVVPTPPPAAEEARQPTPQETPASEPIKTTPSANGHKEFIPAVKGEIDSPPLAE